MNGPDHVSSRPFLIGLVMLIVFMSLHSDWTMRRSIGMRPGGRESPAQHREAVKEKIILDLSLSNEKLEEENSRLKVDVYTLRHQLQQYNQSSLESGLYLSKASLEPKEPKLASDPPLELPKSQETLKIPPKISPLHKVQRLRGSNTHSAKESSAHEHKVEVEVDNDEVIEGEVDGEDGEMN
eukprot:CAMPEP_0196570612 /NCGR_PEP_ID=MMETSP1081-20130531/754_1 /TAXON_ID=36882 /ORGANISM="Pyramimonas amylifera, Strain CCMP720" /LENGTH=181 /DNA_ID=CAMNT_0041887153 /DNA_START=290 /DNA_END=835 /DNA_ORIENTATION=-